MVRCLKPQKAFTLLELMITVVLTTILVLGVGSTYITVKGTATQLRTLENAQEVLRGVYDTLSYSTKRAASVEHLSDTAIKLTYTNESGSQLACDGSTQANAFTETFRLTNNQLHCSIGNAQPIVLLTGIEQLTFTLMQGTTANINVLLTVVITPQGLPEIYKVANSSTPAVRLDFAFKSIILNWAT